MNGGYQTTWLESQSLISCKGKLRQDEIGLAIREAQDYAHGHRLRVIGGAISVIYHRMFEDGTVWCEMEVMLPVRP